MGAGEGECKQSRGRSRKLSAPPPETYGARFEKVLLDELLATRIQ
jgi:hypothetical protein